MIRAASALLLSSLAAGPVLATTYSATPTSAPSGRVIDRNVVWSCGPAACVGRNDDARPALVCQSLARKVGRLESFIVDGKAFAAADLERCNASAKAKGTIATAANAD